MNTPAGMSTVRVVDAGAADTRTEKVNPRGTPPPAGRFLTPRQVRGVHTGAENRAGVERTKGGTGGGVTGERIVVAALQPPAHPTGGARALRVELARITDDHDEGPPFGGQRHQPRLTPGGYCTKRGASPPPARKRQTRPSGGSKR